MIIEPNIIKLFSRQYVRDGDDWELCSNLPPGFFNLVVVVLRLLLILFRVVVQPAIYTFKMSLAKLTSEFKVNS